MIVKNIANFLFFYKIHIFWWEKFRLFIAFIVRFHEFCDKWPNFHSLNLLKSFQKTHENCLIWEHFQLRIWSRYKNWSSARVGEHYLVRYKTTHIYHHPEIESWERELKKVCPIWLRKMCKIIFVWVVRERRLLETIMFL